MMRIFRSAKLVSVYCLLLSFAVLPAFGQEKPKGKGKTPAATPTPVTVATPAPAPVVPTKPDNLLGELKFREIGPATMGGRIDDIEVVPGDPRTIYVATAA